MNLIILYGPPATGKLTLAKEISKKKDYKIFDNHCLIDFLNQLVLGKTLAFEPKVTKDFFKLYRKIRLETLKTACKLKDINGLIITEAYVGRKRFMGNMIKIAKKNKCKIYMVKLNCDLGKLEKRVYGESRKKSTKVKSKTALYNWFERFEGRSNLVYPHKKTLILDNTKRSIRSSANQILNFIN